MFFLIFSLFFINKKRVGMGFSSVGNPSTKWMEQARSFGAGFQDPFCQMVLVSLLLSMLLLVGYI